MIRTIINGISQEFIREALNSPTLIEDMASMEKYMAESYGERILIELLQNADDAQSSSIQLVQQGEHLYFANDGRPFNREDIIGISRSGASNKQRGSSIGYRGVGFKSTSYLSNRILIYSNGTYFTFSKETCAEVLGMSPEKVPTIRIPFLIEENEVDTNIHRTIESFLEQGFTTIFVFVNARIGFMEEEVKAVNNGYFLFLRHLEFVNLEIGQMKKSLRIRREHRADHSFVSIEGEKIYQWWLYNYPKERKVSLAFLLNEEGIVKSCSDDEAVFHCYLPTLEKTGYPFKINSDFSTDPSRKHLIMDEENRKIILQISNSIFNLISSLIKREDSNYPSGILDLLSQKRSFAKFSNILSEQLKEHIGTQVWLTLSTGEKICPTNYIKEPSWLEPSEFQTLARYSPYVQKRRLTEATYERIPNLHCFLSNYSSKEYQLEDWVEILKEKDLALSLNKRLYGKIMGQIMKNAKLKEAIHGKKVDLSSCLVPINEQVIPLKDVHQMEPEEISQDFKAGLNESVTTSEISWFDKTYATTFTDFVKTDEKITPVIVNSSASQTISKGITKWRAAEQQCVELEELWGNYAKDISKQNLGYDVESKTPNGETRYIEVKSIGKNVKSFTLTNNEFSAAHQLGENYYLCIVSQDESKFVATYIPDPVHSLSMEKRVRQWEWFCEDFEGEQYTLKFK